MQVKILTIWKIKGYKILVNRTEVQFQTSQYQSYLTVWYDWRRMLIASIDSSEFNNLWNVMASYKATTKVKIKPHKYKTIENIEKRVWVLMSFCYPSPSFTEKIIYFQQTR